MAKAIVLEGGYFLANCGRSVELPKGAIIEVGEAYSSVTGYKFRTFRYKGFSSMIDIKYIRILPEGRLTGVLYE